MSKPKTRTAALLLGCILLLTGTLLACENVPNIPDVSGSSAAESSSDDSSEPERKLSAEEWLETLPERDYAGTVFTIAATETGYVVPADEEEPGLVDIAAVKRNELIAANPQFADPNLIYPGQKVYVPLDDPATLSFEEQVVELVNAYRAQYGLSALTADWELARVARYKSQDMHDRGYFAHNSPTYGTPFDMIRSFGLSYRTAGENIAKGYATPQAVVNGWMNSSGHRANILNGSFTKIGVGYVADGHIWTQLFIG